MRKFKQWREIVSGWLAAAVLLWAAGAAQAVAVWNEGVNGDLSNNRLAPTSLSLAFGSNLLTATSIGGAGIDREYVTFNMPANSRLIALLMEAYAGSDGRSFIGVQSGATFTEPPTGTAVGNLLGYTHFGETDFNAGDDILPSLGMGAGSMEFTPPLPGGNYTFWIQQTGPSSTTYTLDFMVVPEPGTVGLIGIAAVMLGVSGAKWRRGREMG